MIFYLDDRIESYDIQFNQGKDNGLSARFVSVAMLSGLFFFVMSEQKKFFVSLIGVVVGVLSFILGYFMFNDGLIFHVLCCLIVIFVFFLLKRTKLLHLI